MPGFVGGDDRSRGSGRPKVSGRGFGRDRGHQEMVGRQDTRVLVEEPAMSANILAMAAPFASVLV